MYLLCHKTPVGIILEYAYNGTAFNEVKRRTSQNVNYAVRTEKWRRNKRAIRFGYLRLIPLTFHRYEAGDTSAECVHGNRLFCARDT